MNRINEIILETRVKKTGMTIGIILFIINIALLVGLQVTKTPVPEIVNINMLLTIGGILLLKVRPRF